MPVRFAELVDIAALQRLLDRLHEATGIPAWVLTPESEILAGRGWQDICAKFHRASPEAERICIESDGYIAHHLHDGPFVGYQCGHGIMDYACPIIIEGEHVATLFTGQFFHESPDENLFRVQARRYGFDEEGYLTAAREVPVIERERIAPTMEFLRTLADTLAALGLSRLREVRERDAEIREKRRALETLIANLPGMAYRCRNDADWTLEFASEGCRYLTGYSVADFVDTRHVSYGSLIHEDDRQMVWDAVQAAIAERRQFEVAYRIRAADGTERWVWEKGQGVFGDDGALAAIEGFITDITERKRMEEHAEILARLPDENPGPVIRIHRDGRMLYANGPAGRMFAKSEGDTSDTRATLREMAEEAFRTDAGVETEIVAGRRTYRIIVTRVYHADYVNIYGTDITERKAMETALRESEANLRVFLDTIPETALLLDTAGTILMTNETAAQRFRRPFAGFIGARYFDLLPELLATARRRHIARVIETGEPTRFEDVRNGRTVYSSVYPVFDAAGAVVRLAVLSVDITERKRTEEALRNLATNLVRSNVELEQFAYVASHDLQEPLRTIASYVQLLAKRYRGQLDGKADTYIGYAVDGANRMQQLINDLLAWSRVGTRGKPFEPVDMTSLLGRVLTDMAITVRTSGALVTNAELPLVMGDRAQLEQLFQNLLSNSIKFHGAAPPAIHVAVREEGDAWVFAVHDNGIGIAPQYHERIFEFFQRLHTREEYPGTGIGLAVCRKIVERHGGRMWVESASGAGTIMFFSILKREETDNA